MDSYEFANLISFSDLGRGRLAAVLEVLWCETDRRERKNVRVVTNSRLAIDDDVRVEPDAVAEHDVIADRSERSDITFVAYLRTCADDRSLVNKCCHRSRGAQEAGESSSLTGGGAVVELR